METPSTPRSYNSHIDDSTTDEEHIDDEDEKTSIPMSAVSFSRFMFGSAVVLNIVLIVTFIVLLFKLYLQREHLHVNLKVFVPPANNNYYWKFPWETFTESKRDSYAIISQYPNANIEILTVREAPHVVHDNFITCRSYGSMSYLQDDFDYEYFSFALLPGSQVNITYFLEFHKRQSDIFLAIINNDYFARWSRDELPSYLYDKFNLTLNKDVLFSYDIQPFYRTAGRYDFIFYYSDRFHDNTLSYGYAIFDVRIPNELKVDKKTVVSSCNLKQNDCWVAPHSIVVFNVTGDQLGDVVSVKTRSAQGDTGRLITSLVPLFILAVLDVILVFVFLTRCAVRRARREKQLQYEVTTERSGLINDSS